MAMHFENLDEIEMFMKTKKSKWILKRGKDTIFSPLLERAEELKDTNLKQFVPEPAEDYEVLQIFRPGEENIPYAEFWKGFYDFNPSKYIGCCHLNEKPVMHWIILGTLDNIMQAVFEELSKI